MIDRAAALVRQSPAYTGLTAVISSSVDKTLGQLVVRIRVCTELYRASSPSPSYEIEVCGCMNSLPTASSMHQSIRIGNRYYIYCHSPDNVVYIYNRLRRKMSLGTHLLVPTKWTGSWISAGMRPLDCLSNGQIRFQGCVRASTNRCQR